MYGKQNQAKLALQLLSIYLCNWREFRLLLPTRSGVL